MASNRDKGYIGFLVSVFLIGCTTSFVWGWWAHSTDIYPGKDIKSAVNEFNKFLAGDPDLSITDKLANDLGLIPSRQLKNRAGLKVFTGCEGLNLTIGTVNSNCGVDVSFESNSSSQKERRQILTSRPIFLPVGKYQISMLFDTNRAVSNHGDFVLKFGGEKQHLISGWFDQTIRHILANQEPIRYVPFVPKGERHQIASFSIDKPSHFFTFEIEARHQLPISIKQFELAQISSTPSSTYSYPQIVDRRSIKLDFQKERRVDSLTVTKFQRSKGFLKDKYLFVFGVTDTEEGLFGVSIIDENLDLVRTIPLSETDIIRGLPDDLEYLKPENNFPHGFVLLENGDFVLNDGDHGNSMRRFDVCGNLKWTSYGRFHHTISHGESNDLWSFLLQDLVQLDAETGKIINTISPYKITQSNPKNNVLQIRYDIRAKKELYDHIHWNDVEPLPSEYADAFPDFNVGDLLVSARNLNLVAVLDPVSLEIKWWRSNGWIRQHDPDWQPDGTISIFDNQMQPGPANFGSGSRIVKIDPKTFEQKVIFDGDRYLAYTHERGKHQITRDGILIMTLPDQGRALIMGDEGVPFLEIENNYLPNKNALISEVVIVEKSKIYNILTGRC